MRIVGLHRVPWSDDAFRLDIESLPSSPDQFRLVEEIRESWNNAWIVVIESSDPVESIDFSMFAHPVPGPNAQAAWQERVLTQRPDRSTLAFFLHFVDRTKPLWYGNTPLDFPDETSAPTSLVDGMPYFAPD